MSNGDKMIQDDKFEQMIEHFDPPAKFLARQIREIQILCAKRESCYPTFQFSRKQIAVGAGGIGSITVVVSVVAEILSKLLQG